jgi:hypothetical protein
MVLLSSGKDSFFSKLVISTTTTLNYQPFKFEMFQKGPKRRSKFLQWCHQRNGKDGQGIRLA